MPGLVRLPPSGGASLRPLAPAAPAVARPPRDASNRLLATLSARDIASFETVTLPSGTPLFTAGEEQRHCHFLESGLVSVVRPTGPRRRAEVWLVGRDGMIGLQAIYGVPRVRHDAIALTPCRARRVSVAAFRRLLALRRGFRDRMLRYAYARMAEAMQLSACHASHAVRARLARWLLLADERLSDENGAGEAVEITHATLAALFNVRRAGITQSLHVLEGEGAIRATRRRIEVRDRACLAALSCGCEAAVRHEFAQVFADDT